MATPNKTRTDKSGEHMMNQPDTNDLPRVGPLTSSGKVWGKVACTVFGVEPYERESSQKWGYIPTQRIFYELDDGTILNCGGDYGVHIWYLIGTHQHLAIGGVIPERLTEPRYGFESPWTSRKAEIFKRTRSVIPPAPTTPYEDTDFNEYAYGLVVQQLDLCHVLVDVGCGTMTVRLGDWHNSHSANWPQIGVGDFIKCQIWSTYLYNVRPISAYEGIPGKVLRSYTCLEAGDQDLHIELLNGEMVYGFAGRGDIETYPEDILGIFVNFHWWLIGDIPLEHIAEPRYGITSTLTSSKQDVLAHSYPNIGWSEEGYFEGGVFTIGTGSPEMDEEYDPPWEQQVTLYGILKEVPYHEDLLLDSGMGTLFVPAKEGFAPGDFVKVCIDDRLRIEELPGYPTD